MKSDFEIGSRYLLSILAGTIVGLTAWSAFDASATQYVFRVGVDADNWTPLQWDGHYVFRTVASLLSVSLASFVSAVIARSRGGTIAVLTNLPSTLTWLGVALFGWTGAWMYDNWAEPLTGTRIAAGALALSIPVLSWFIGTPSASFGSRMSPHFDGRGGTLLGVKWYNYIWISFVLYPLLMSAFWAIVMPIVILNSHFHIGRVLFGVPAFVVPGLIFSLGLSITGLARMYQMLAGFASVQNQLVYTVRYLFAYQVIAGLVQWILMVYFYWSLM